MWGVTESRTQSKETSWAKTWAFWPFFLHSLGHTVVGRNEEMADLTPRLGKSPPSTGILRSPPAMLGKDWMLSWTFPLLCSRAVVLLPSLFSQLSRSVVSNSSRPHGLQHARPPCPSPTPGVYSNSSPLNQWCHPIISFSAVPFSSCPQSFPASGSFPMSQLFTSGGQSIGVSVSTSVLPMNTQDWSPLGWTGWICLQSKGLKSLLQRPSSKASILRLSTFSIVQLPHPYITTGKTIALTRQTLLAK